VCSSDLYTLWLNAKKEYDQIVDQEISSCMNILQAVAIANSMIQETCSIYFNQLDFVFGRFITSTQDQRQDYDSFKIYSILDYLAYCAQKTQKNLETIKILMQNGMVENALATVRFIFESYITATVYIKDQDLFNEKVLPLARLDQGIYSRIIKNDGTISRHFIKDNQTNKIFNTQISIKDFVTNRSSKNDEAFYSLLYNDLSQYIHVDVLAAKKYFSPSDPFYEVDEAFLAGYLGVFFSIQLISTFSNFEGIPVALKNDLYFFISKAKKDIAIILEFLICFDERPFYKNIRSCL
jgi:hypothetical protein